MTLKRATKRPFVLGPECGVLSVPGAVEIMRRMLEAVVNVEVPQSTMDARSGSRVETFHPAESSRFPRQKV